jgi:hypothetical protein
MQVVPNYSPKSFAVYGDTKPYADSLKALGGSFNPNLRGYPGWIFSNTNYDRVVQFVNQVNAAVGMGTVAIAPSPSPKYVAIPAPPTSPQIVIPRPRTAGTVVPTVTIPPTMGPATMYTAPPSPAVLPTTPLQIFQYTEKSIAVLGDTKPFRKDLKAAGGSFNSNLQGHAGWIFPLTKYAQVDDLVTRINAGLPLPPKPQKKQKTFKPPTQPMQIYQYGTDIAVLGETKPFKEQLKVIGGKYNKDIQGNKGWVFPADYYPSVNDFVTRTNALYFR